MAVTPGVEAPPQSAALAEPPRRADASRRRSLQPFWPWVRLVAVLLVAVVSEAVYVFFWPLSYYLTQATAFTYEYLVENPDIWERQFRLLERFDQFWPGASSSLDFLVDAL